MNDEQNKMQLIKELEDLRQKVSELKESEDNRKRIEEKLRKSEKRLKLVGEIAYDVIYEWTVADDKLEWFGNIDEILGYKYNEVPRTIEGWLRLIHPEDVVCLEDAVEYHRISTKPIFNEYRVKHNDGTWRYWSDRGLPMVNEDGHPYKWMGVCTDFTERKKLEVDLRKVHQELEKKVEDRTANLKIANEQLQQEINVRTQAEEELWKSKEKFSSLVTNIPGVVYKCACDQDWTMEFISDEIEVLSGYPASDFIKNAVRSYASIILPDDSQLVEDTVIDGVNHNLPYTIEYRVINRDDSTRWVYERGKATKDKSGGGDLLRWGHF